MRISDWSSDVCSSDLLGGALDMLLNRTYRNTVPLCNLLIFPTLDTSQHEYDPGSIRQRLKYFHGAREALLLCQDVLGRKIHTCVKRFVKLIMRMTAPHGGTPHVIGENILGHPVDIALRIFDRIESAALHEPLEDLLHHVLGCCIRSEEHTSELQSLMRISYAVFCLKQKKKTRIPKE